ncbi:helix-turn-helix domain-containing protein [Actinoplanes nipponensis]|uniref:helix-turn-helix domain-containing protein n=1 Tax=Actinoplanes nipponensis TaxID=135950 RepID=UPI001944B9C3|nr:helix-turn-helix transcriptional regulator [Actinoplanes nipponensis]
MAKQVGPAVARERLGVRLREIRDSLGLPAEAAAREMYWSAAKLERVEAGAVPVAPVEVRALLEFYGVRGRKERETLLGLAAAARVRRWWRRHRLTKEYRQFVGYEEEASRISIYQALFLPGLLQTEDYARAITAKILRRGAGAEEVRARIEVRMARQRTFLDRVNGAAGPELIVALDEAVLRRPVGGIAVLRRQLDHLLAMAALPAITVVVVPLGLEGHPGLGGTFELLEFAGSGRPDMLFLEAVTRDFIVTDEEATAPYRESMKILREVGWSGEDALGVIGEIRDSLRVR